MENTDKYLVQRGTESFNLAKEDTKFIQPDDLFLVNRDGVNYSITGAVFLEEGGGGGVSNPDKINAEDNAAANPDYAGGTGTLTDPFIITAPDSTLGGKTFSDQLITLFNLTPGLEFTIIDTNADTNGIKFKQPKLTAVRGYVNFRMEFFDKPESTGGGSESSILNIGDIYWKWDVTVLPTGVQMPIIQEILDQGGSYYPPIQGPDFTPTLQEAGDIISEIINGLTPDQTLEDVPTATVTGVGTGLTLDIITDANGDSKYFFVKVGGTDYAFGDQVTVDLTSIGGSSVTPLTVYTKPVSAPSITFKINSFVSVGAGDFLKQQWYIGTEPDFGNPDNYDIYDVTDNTTNPTVITNLPTGSVFYAKCRFLSQSQVFSAWSETCKAGTFASYSNFSYILSNQDLTIEGKGGTFKSFESPEINIEKIPGTYFSYITQATGLVSPWPNGKQCNSSPIYGGASSGRGNESNCQAVWIQVRNPINLTVTGVDASGAVQSVNQANFPIGLPDYFMNKDVATTTSGVGTGYKFTITRLNGITTWLSTAEGGAGYALGDTITFTPPLGHGGNGSVQSVEVFNQGWTDIEVGHSTLTMDSEHDILLQGIGSTGGAGGTARSGGGRAGVQKWIGSEIGVKGVDENGGGFPGGGPGPGGVEAPNDIYPGRGGEPGDCREIANYAYGMGGAGGAGWGMGSNGGSGTWGAEFRPGGGGGGSGCSKVNKLFITNPTECATTTSYGKKACYLFVGGVEVAADNDFFFRLY